MTTPNEELIGRLRAGAFPRSMGHWGDLHCEAADAMQSQAERIAELERESETHSKAYGQQCAAHARELALNEAIAICRRNAQNTSADELEALKGK